MHKPCPRRSAITCPYCKYRYEDSWEFPIQGEEECENCGKNFHFTSETEVCYSTTPDCELNGKQHEYVGTVGWKECSVCGHLEGIAPSCLTDVYYQHELRQDMQELHDARVNGKRGWNPYASYYHNVLKEKEDRFCKTFEEGLEAYNRRTDHQE